MSAPSPPVWNLSLASWPRLKFCGVGRHGGLEPSHAYHYPRHWCLHAYQYHGILAIDGTPYEVQPGTVSLVRPGARFEHRWPGPDCVHYFAIFGLSSRGATAVAVPALIRLGAGFDAFKSSLEPAIHGAATLPLRAAARLWDLLWTLAEFSDTTSQIVGPHPALVRAHRWMQDHPAELIHLHQLAAHCGVSANHLIRLFKKEHGVGPAEWHRFNRINRAELLLRHSSLSVKAVAIETGFTDLQQFNKLVRKQCGSPPRKMREVMRRRPASPLE